MTTDRRVLDTRLEYQLNIGSAHKIHSPNKLISAHQTSVRSADPNKKNKTAIFDKLNIKMYFVEMDGIRYLRDSVNVVFNTKLFLDRYILI